MAATMNLFGSVIPNLNTTFLVDTSGSMYSCLVAVREHLSSYLRVHAVDVANPQQTLLFNLIEFNSDIRRWADRCVFWSHASVLVADDWLHSLVPKTGTNTLGGLLTAFTDSLCQQVVLITDGIPDQEPNVILHFLQQKQQEKRPCHIFYINTPLNTAHEQETVVKFLQDLAALTGGSLTIAYFSRTGTLEGLAPMINYQIENAVKPVVLVDGSLNTGIRGPPMETGVSSEVGALLARQECLARKDKDGYYYRGKILNQLNINQFMVEFGPRTTGAFSESDFQPTYLFDIIHYTDALMHNIKTGDFVLAPDGQQGRFVPAEVLDGFEKRASCESGEIRQLVVHFANGKTVTLKRLQEAIWIPSALYERIKFELAIPSSARQFLQTHSAAYPAVLLPGYPMPTPIPMKSDNWPFFIPTQQQPTIAPVVLAPQQSVPATVNSYEVNNLIMSSQQKPQSLMTSNELNRKVDQQIQHHWFLLGERSPSASQISQHSTSLSTIPMAHSHPDHYPHHHHHSHSANSSPNSSEIRKKNVCFNDASTIRRYSVDDLVVSQESTTLKSCLKSSSSVTTIQNERSPSTDIIHHSHTQTIPSSQKARPHSAAVLHDAYRPSSVSAPIEHWHTRQLKSAPIPSTSNGQSSTIHDARRQNLNHLYEKAQQEVKKELQQQQIQREQYKRQQAKEQSQRFQNRLQQETEKSDRIIGAKRQFRSQIIHQNHQRTQAVEDQVNQKLRCKQNQYAQRSSDRIQTRRLNEQRTTELSQYRQHDVAQRSHAHHENVLSQEFGRLYKDVIARKFREETDHKTKVLRHRDEKHANLIHEIENRRTAWSNPSVFS
ncbi:unnamed protein product [Rotaria socialis]|uniref:VWFA domain-containing protein n=1 Tax=Rotaria socialis TaxID=392032 RepID=A0A819BU70_9BILA|nr:unnamed protein product [Rotaria socialis]CAF3807755.1 unnamed protein product [Rotaria socialis]CAF4354627.1 unnamed protein product [Rotaria socialis]CAF4535726.1 unnamed protein product [Rotaria socialis]